MKYFVIAGTVNQFKTWYNRNYPEMLLSGQIDKLQDIVYVSGLETLKGYQEPHGIFIGTWYKRPDIESIITQLQIADSILPWKAQELMNIAHAGRRTEY